MKVFLIAYNRLESLRSMVDSINELDELDEVVIVDNASTYPPLLEWYKDAPATVVRLPRNMGNRAAWESACVEDMAGEWYAVSDPDLDLEGVPADCLPHLREGLLRYPDYNKCGLSLRIDDLRMDLPRMDEVYAWESSMWTVALDPEFFACSCDTTFAVYHKPEVVPYTKSSEHCFSRALRANKPYTARHLPWYTGPDELTDEDVYYIQHMEHRYGGWTNEIAAVAGLASPDHPFVAQCLNGRKTLPKAEG